MVDAVSPLSAWLKLTAEMPEPSDEPLVVGARVPNESSHVPGFVVE